MTMVHNAMHCDVFRHPVVELLTWDVSARRKNKRPRKADHLKHVCVAYGQNKGQFGG